jgi:hypothetical protein
VLTVPLVATITLSGKLAIVHMLGMVAALANPAPPAADKWGYTHGVKEQVKSSAPQSAGPAPAGIPEKFYWVNGDIICRPGEISLIVCFPHRPSEPGVSPQAQALSEWRRLSIPAPEVRTAPPRGTQGLVGLPHWFWVTNWRALTDRAQAGSSWIEIVARPQSMVIDPGGGQPTVRCSGPGNAYDPARSAEYQQPACSHTFARSSFGQAEGAYQARVTVLWGGTWIGSGGAGGQLPPVSRSASFPIRVVEAQGLYR